MNTIITFIELIVVFYGIVIIFRYPLLGLLLWILADTSFFQFISMERMPYLQLFSGLRINFSDGLILLLTAISCYRLAKRREQPLFLVPLLLWVIMIGTLFVVHFIAGNVDLNSGFNVLRNIIGYITYIFYVGIIDNPKTLDKVVRFVWMILVVSVLLQFVEFSLGHRIVFDAGGINTYYGYDVFLDLAGIKVLYAWNRAWTYSQIGTYLALGLFLNAGIRNKMTVLFLSILGTFGVLITLIRQGYVSFALSLSTIMFLSRSKLRAIVSVALLSLFIFGIASLTPLVSNSLAQNPLNIWASRLGLLQDYQNDSSYQVRMGENQRVWQLIVESPLVGYGPGQVWQKSKGLDIGVLNIILMLGFPGFLIVLSVWLAAFWYGYHLWRRLPPGQAKGLTAGTLAFLLGVFFISAFGANYMLTGFTPAIGMGLIDRLYRFSMKVNPANEQVSDKV